MVQNFTDNLSAREKSKLAKESVEGK
jgi:hypothetical protein